MLVNGGRTAQSRQASDMDSLYPAALQCLQCPDPASKLALTAATQRRWHAGELDSGAVDAPIENTSTVGRPERPRLVAPRNLPRRRLGSVDGRAALLHAVAHIEFNAINLAWDAVYRFRGMPVAYYEDWINVAADEARHFALLAERLRDAGYAYGDFDAHDGLWEMAGKTAESCLARMALVPRVLEARGLDVTPGMIERLREVDDHASVAVLELILREEVAHVAAGTRWFHHCCKAQGAEPRATFAQLIKTHMGTPPKPPFNREARIKAGFSIEELEQLECAGP